MQESVPTATVAEKSRRSTSVASKGQELPYEVIFLDLK